MNPCPPAKGIGPSSLLCTVAPAHRPSPPLYGSHIAQRAAKSQNVGILNQLHRHARPSLAAYMRDEQEVATFPGSLCRLPWDVLIWEQWLREPVSASRVSAYVLVPPAIRCPATNMRSMLVAHLPNTSKSAYRQVMTHGAAHEPPLIHKRQDIRLHHLRICFMLLDMHTLRIPSKVVGSMRGRCRAPRPMLW